MCIHFWKTMSSRDILRTIAQTPVQISLNNAIQDGNTCLVQLIIESGEVVDGNTFIYACKCGHIDIVRLLLDLPHVSVAADEN